MVYNKTPTICGPRDGGTNQSFYHDIRICQARQTDCQDSAKLHLTVGQVHARQRR
jgi:hypothetical protein